MAGKLPFNLYSFVVTSIITRFHKSASTYDITQIGKNVVETPGML
jgi:hypothetical protein